MFKTSIEANRGLINVFTDEKATNEQTHDLLNAQKIGEQGYINYVTHNILQLSSVLDAPVRFKQLLTMAPLKKKQKTLISGTERTAPNQQIFKETVGLV